VPLEIDELLARVWPGSQPSQRAELVASGAVEVEGRLVRKTGTVVGSGRRVELNRQFGPEQGPIVSTVGLVARVLVPSLPFPAGVLARRKGMKTGISFETLEERRGVSLLSLGPDVEAGDAESFAGDLRRALAEAGHPVLADVDHGGILVAGGLRLLLARAGSPVWPDEPVFPGDVGPPPILRVSGATARILARGHPWILRDDESDDARGFAPGTRVTLRGPDDADLGSACIEGPGRLMARIWTSPRRPREAASVEARVAAALRRRSSLLSPRDGEPVTDVFRLVHGEADGLPGLFVDRLGSLLRVLITSPGTGRYRERAIDALVRALEDQIGAEPPIVEVLHLRERPHGELVCTYLARGSMPANSRAAGHRFWVRERGVAYLVDPGLTRPTRASPGFGLYPDQRDNRARLIAAAPKRGRLLNLFAHTGAFSVAWLAAGQGQAVSVDLSGTYLRWLEENLAANEIDPGRHRSVRQDGRRFLETLDASERFHAIVLDPPTAAAAGRRFWSVAKELPPLVERALRHLAPGGRLLVCRNDRRRSALGDLVAEAADRAGVRLSHQQPALPGVDFPRHAGFPEGDSFTGVLATRS
jgi:23S rRNA (cytosine1962-C5)-methyltransferase